MDEFYCLDYLAPHLDESMSIFEFNSLTEHLSKLDGYQETALEGLLQMQVNKHMQENGGPITAVSYTHLDVYKRQVGELRPV